MCAGRGRGLCVCVQCVAARALPLPWALLRPRVHSGESSALCPCTLARPPARAQALGRILDAATRAAILVPRSGGGDGGEEAGGGGGNDAAATADSSFPVDEETRSKAVRLTANRLLPEGSLEAAILERARAELEAGMSLAAAAADAPVAAADAVPADATAAAKAATTTTSTSTTAADRHIELFCALTTRRPAALLPALLGAFARSAKGSPGRAAAVHR